VTGASRLQVGLWASIFWGATNDTILVIAAIRIKIASTIQTAKKIDKNFKIDMGKGCAKINDISTDYKYPLTSFIANFSTTFTKVLQSVIENSECIDDTVGDGTYTDEDHDGTYTDGDGAGTDGNGSLCGENANNTSYSDKDVCDNVYFLGIYVAFLSSLVFGW
jgi:hypothetical protein